MTRRRVVDFKKLGLLISIAGVVVIVFGCIIWAANSGQPANNEKPGTWAHSMQNAALPLIQMQQAYNRGRAIKIMGIGFVIGVAGLIISASAKPMETEVSSVPDNSSPQSMPLRRRELVAIGIMSALSLGIYGFYLIYQWAKELNGLEGRTKYNPRRMLLISIFTLGAGMAIIECIFALEVENKNLSGALGAIPFFILVCILNGVAWIFGLFTSYWIISLLAGTAATVLIQHGFNMLIPEGGKQQSQ